MHSLSRRLLISVSLPLALFFGVMMLVLDSGFRAFSERSLHELLDAQMVSLIAAADPQRGRWLCAPGRGARTAPGHAPLGTVRADPLGRARVALALHARTAERFRSAAAARASAASPTQTSATIASPSRAARSSSRTSPNEAGTFTFSVAVSLSPYEEQLWQFRRELLGWFIGLMLALLLTLAALLRWVLAPVRRLEREIHEVEEGRSEKLGGGYPRELVGRRRQPERAPAR